MKEKDALQKVETVISNPGLPAQEIAGVDDPKPTKEISKQAVSEEDGGAKFEPFTLTIVF